MFPDVILQAVLVFQPRMNNLNLIMRKDQTNPKMRSILLKTKVYILKKVSVIKGKERL